MVKAIDFGRAVAFDASTAERREWLITNGIGGFASGTVSDVATRRYHGLLFAATKPPVGRRLLVTRLEATLDYDGATYELFANRWSDGTTTPAGYDFLERFYLEGTSPVWVFAAGDARLERRIWMEHGANRTFVRFRLERALRPARLMVKAFVNDRDLHAVASAGEWQMQLKSITGGVRVTAFEGATPFSVRADRGEATLEHVWYRDHFYAEERARGLGDREDHLHAATFVAGLAPGETATFDMGLELPDAIDGAAGLDRARSREQELLARWRRVGPKSAVTAPHWLTQLVLAADQFRVARPIADDPGARSTIAGYPWFGDWGRDTMIALPGLTLATGRPQEAVKILETFARYIDAGMLPNYFPDAGDRPEYNTVDAALWFVEAVRQTVETLGDRPFLRRVWPALREIVTRYRSGTRFGIREDPSDGLLFAGEPGIQLTWMDAKVGDWVVTPRIGKAVEVNALWLNANASLARFARMLGERAAEADFELLAKRTTVGFDRFWNADKGYLYDVLDGPDGNDATLRPNQLFAVSLPQSPLSRERMRAVADICARKLVTSMGVRSLDPDDPHYRSRYGGSPLDRDGAYHQGTVWGWLIGPFAFAYARAYGDQKTALGFVEAFGRQLDVYGLGTLPEIADGAPPHMPRGCIAQAWSVAEVLRAWTALSSMESVEGVG